MYEAYANMREEHPIYLITNRDGSRNWLVTRHEDIIALIDDERLTKSILKLVGEDQGSKLNDVEQMLLNNLNTLDPPDHTRLRKLVQKAFSPRLVQSMRPRIRAIADALLDAVQDQGGMELIADYAYPLPLQVITELLGIPAEDREQFLKWTRVFAQPRQPHEERMQDSPEMKAFLAYLKEICERRREEPLDDLLSALVKIEDEGRYLREIELYSMLVLLIVAGYETTANLIGNGVLVLIQNPKQLVTLRNNPWLIGSTVEELLRYDCPIETSPNRYVLEDFTFQGQHITHGDIIQLVLGSANRDSACFGLDADELNITRTNNSHLAFGHGIHYCVGSALARMEGAIAIGTLLERAPQLRLAVPMEELRIRPSIYDFFRGYHEIPIRWD